MAEHHQVTILDEALVAAVNLSSRYITGRQLPDKAISVLDTACARVALSREGKPAAIEDVSVLIANIEREMVALEREEGHAERLAELKAFRERLHDAQPVTHLKLCIEPVRRQTTGHTLYCNPQYGLMRCSRQ